LVLISDWMEMKTAPSVRAGDQGGPCHVFRMDRHTLPSAYRLGPKRTDPPPVVMNRTLGGTLGKSAGTCIRK